MAISSTMRTVLAISTAGVLTLAFLAGTTFSQMSSAVINFQADAQEASPDEDPHTDATGTLEVTTETTDGHTHITYIYTSDDLKKKYGYSTLLRVAEYHSQQGVSPPADGKKVEKDVKMKVLFESDAEKLQKHQDAKNKGLPMMSYLQWDVVEPIAQDTSNTGDVFSNSIVAFLRFVGILQTAEATHVEKWAHKSQAYSPYDPINIIWSDPVGTGSSVVATDVHNRMIHKGWGAYSACIVVTTLYVNVNGVYKGQDQHKFKNIAGCDQYHVRIWSINGNTAIGAAHKEIAYGNYLDIRHISTSGPNYWEDHQLPGHVLISLEGGESQVASAFVGASSERFPTCWTVTANTHSMSNSYTREYWNDARTTKLYSAANGSTATTVAQKTC